ARLAGGGVRASDNASELGDAIGHHDHYLFVLVDGLGVSLQDRFPRGGFFTTSLARPLNSVFPSTTAVALTSLATAAWPAEHGITGWFTYFPEHRRVIAPLLFRERATDIAGGEIGLGMNDLVTEKPVLGSFFRTVASVLPKEISTGEYATWSRAGTPIVPYRSFEHARRILTRLYRRPAGPTYTYLYLLTVDKLSHVHGSSSDEVAAEVRRVDGMLARVRESIPPSVRMIVTADHGLVDVPRERHYELHDDDPLARHLLAGQTGEAAAPVFHVEPGTDEQSFLDAFTAHPASASFSLFRTSELARRGVYGPVPLSDAASLHLGDYVGIATDPATLEYVPDGRTAVAHVGVHGGLRPGEIQVPLFLA
ncbi:MAG TPA: alkaline phosphatase family protein, partial [Spirochaetia bacterium]|nr:alkaline phosphatase family protein [Spirochaetia bacterium]